MKVFLSKTTKRIFEIHGGESILEQILRMNESHNLYSGDNFTWEYELMDRNFYVIDKEGNEFLMGITVTDPEINFPYFNINFIALENGDYAVISSSEFGDDDDE